MTPAFDTAEVELHSEAATEDVLARFELGEELGTGGFSVVRRAVDRVTGLEVAIKAVEKAKYAPTCTTLQREVEVLSKVQHPCCVRLFAVFDTPRFVYLVTDIVSGGELLDRILQYGAYCESKAACVIGHILSGVAFLHSQGIVHRDLKLENMLMVDPDPSATQVKIADFGLSRFITPTSPEPLATMCGSPAYVAPEILSFSRSKQEYSLAVDMWSAGIILFVLLTGYSPFSADSDAELFEKIRVGAYDTSDPVWATLSEGAQHLVARMLTVNPDHRISAADALDHPWLRQHCPDTGELHVPRTPSPSHHSRRQDPHADRWQGPDLPPQLQEPDTLLLEMGSLSLNAARGDAPARQRGGVARADAVFRSPEGMRSRASSEAGDEEDGPEQPETPGVGERMRRPPSLDSNDGSMMHMAHMGLP